MPLVVTNDGAMALVQWALKAPLVSDRPLSVGLYTNDYTPTKVSQLASFVEPTFSGYHRAPLDRAAWTLPALDGGKASSDYDIIPREWTNGGSAVSVYGYFVLDPSTNKVLWAERFATRRDLATGAKLKVQLRFTGVTEFG